MKCRNGAAGIATQCRWTQVSGDVASVGADGVESPLVCTKDRLLSGRMCSVPWKRVVEWWDANTRPRSAELLAIASGEQSKCGRRLSNDWAGTWCAASLLACSPSLSLQHWNQTNKKLVFKKKTWYYHPLVTREHNRLLWNNLYKETTNTAKTKGKFFSLLLHQRLTNFLHYTYTTLMKDIMCKPRPAWSPHWPCGLRNTEDMPVVLYSILSSLLNVV